MSLRSSSISVRMSDGTEGFDLYVHEASGHVAIQVGALGDPVQLAIWVDSVDQIDRLSAVLVEARSAVANPHSSIADALESKVAA